VLTRNLLLKDKKYGLFLIVAWEKRNTRDTKQLATVCQTRPTTTNAPTHSEAQLHTHATRLFFPP
jgi:hypothetical protein